MRIGFLNDLHIMHNTNMIEEALDVVCQAAKSAEIDKLFIAGDTSESYKISLDFVDLLSGAGIDTYAIFGNHEYWSINYEDALNINHDRYIHGKTVELVNDYIIIGIDGMFDYSFVLDVDNYSNRRLSKDKNFLNTIGKRVFDLKRNKIKNYEEVFADMDSKLINLLRKHQDKNIILMTHYVPSSEFILYKDSDSKWNANNAFMGSTKYQKLAEEYGVDKVIFGHTHNQFNKVINGVSYHCNPIGYKKYEFIEPFRERVASRLKVFEI